MVATEGLVFSVYGGRNRNIMFYYWCLDRRVMEAEANTHKHRDLKEAVADVLAEADFQSAGV